MSEGSVTDIGEFTNSREGGDDHSGECHSSCGGGDGHAAQVPEPAGAAIMGVGLLALFFLARMTRRSLS